ncbi:MAG TPA: hypothetical protein VKB51_19000 [bacterium]|nr:hypothetical protein [bacterium]
MDRITMLDLQALWNEASQPCVSIFLPTHLKGAGTQNDPIVLKNLMRDASEQLVQMELREPEARELLAPVEAIAGNQAFWKEQAPGLAVFRSPRLFRTFHLAHAPAERVVVTRRFHTRPLLPCLEDNAPFHVLAVSLNDVRLLAATGREIQELPLRDAPRSLKDFQKMEDNQGDDQYRQAGQGGTFAAGGHQADRKDAQRRYLRAIANAVEAQLNDSRAPLVFAGVEMLFAQYREVAESARLVSEPVAGSPDRVSAEILRDQALQVLRPLWEAERTQAAADYRRLAGTGRTATGLAQVLPQAAAGRVDTLLLVRETERWGHFADGAPLEIHERPVPGDDELLDLAASLALKAGGRVLTLPEALLEQPEVVDGVAALLRY